MDVDIENISRAKLAFSIHMWTNTKVFMQGDW